MARGSSRAYRKVVEAVILRDGGLCGICGHGGAQTADHVVPYKDWPEDGNGNKLPGADEPDNLRAAHGSRGPGTHNPCTQCDPARWPHGRMCNQSRGAAADQAEPHSRRW